MPPYLEDVDPEIYAAIDAELADGASVDDVVRVMAETSTPGFVKVVRESSGGWRVRLLRLMRHKNSPTC